MTHPHKATNAHLAAEVIRTTAPTCAPRVGIVLGSGLGNFAAQLENQLVFPYESLPGFPEITVHGHEGKLVLGTCGGVQVACLQGRTHFYEGAQSEIIKTYVRTLRLLGCEYFLATNASGSMRPDVGPGELMLITDHINMQPTNPLVGPNDDEFGPRFYPLDNAYDLNLREQLLKCANLENITLHQGVYLSVLGPNYETSAEIRAFRTLGADAVAMSTVPEILVANHCGMKTGGIAVITNYATGLTNISHDHANVVSTAAEASAKLSSLIKRWLSDM